jgi:hypothetical protein
MPWATCSASNKYVAQPGGVAIVVQLLMQERLKQKPGRLPGTVAVMTESTAATAPLLTGRFQRAFTFACEVHAAQLRKGTRIP